MNETLDKHDLHNLPVGATVRDGDNDIWTKQESGLWSAEGIGGYYTAWTSEKLAGSYGSISPVQTEATEDVTETEAAEVTVEGVWIVWSSHNPADGIIGIFPQDAEINALRMINTKGFGRVEFVPFGEVVL